MPESRRDEVRVRYSFFSEVVMVTLESADDTTVVLVDNLVCVTDTLGVFAMVTLESADDAPVVLVDNLVCATDTLGVFAGFG